MMNKNLSEEKKKYEREFCDLLIQRINHAGGSLQFQHLSGLVQQTRFEIRDAFGTTKGELMKFLKAHPKIFIIDSAGIVTICQSTFSDEDIMDTCSNTEIKHTKNLYPKIEKGIGSILKIHPKYGIIKATEPIETLVYFESQAFFNGKDNLLSNSPLLEGDEVHFNAVHCEDDYGCNEIKFRATKVWQKLDECESSNKSYNPPTSDELNGHGIVKSLQADFGFIIDKSKKCIFFHRTSVKDCKIEDLTKFLKNGDCVEFFARFNKDAKTPRWKATSVRKKIKNVKSPTNINPVKTKLENEPGKIYLTSTGAFIKFGKNFTEQADGNSCSFFMYGGEVTDIKWEFSEGDDIFFDAEKTKSAAEWKAVLAWVGEKPVYSNHKKTLSENKSEISDDENVSSINHSSKHLIKRSQSANKSKRVEQNKIFDHSNSRKYGRYDEKFEKHTKKPPNSESFLPKKSKNESERNVNEKDNSFVNRRGRNKNRRGNERKLPSKADPKKLSFNKNVTTTYESKEEIHKTPSNLKSFLSFKDCYSHSSQEDSYDDDDYDEDGFSDKNLVTKRSDKSGPSAPRYNFSDVSDNDLDNSCNEMKSDNNDKNVASIKKYDDVEGKIVNLYCKTAFIESSCLQNSVDFMLNAFYLNGKSVEEQQVIDLKEVIDLGDFVKFNCFEIIDDDGKNHQKVTMAWKGPKPEVYEMTPEEFISEHDLSVTINEEPKPISLSDRITSRKNLLENKDLKSTSSESSKSESEEEVSDSRKSDSDSIEIEEKEESKENEYKILDVNKSLSDKEVSCDDKDSRKSDSDSIEKEEEEESKEKEDKILDVNKSLSDEEVSSDDKDSRKSDSDSIEKEEEEKSKENDDKIVDVNKSLSDTILERLKFKGLIPSNAQVNFSGLLTEVTDLVQKHCDRCNSATCEPEKENSETLSKPNCPLCKNTLFGDNKSESHTATQTIITGGIIAQSIYTQP